VCTFPTNRSTGPYESALGQRAACVNQTISQDRDMWQPPEVSKPEAREPDRNRTNSVSSLPPPWRSGCLQMIDFAAALSPSRDANSPSGLVCSVGLRTIQSSLTSLKRVKVEPGREDL
jgi:hypothetical protein